MVNLFINLLIILLSFLIIIGFTIVSVSAIYNQTNSNLKSPVLLQNKIDVYDTAKNLLNAYSQKMGFENGDKNHGWEWEGGSKYDTAPERNCDNTGPGSIDTTTRLDTVQNVRIEGIQSLNVTVCPFDYRDNGARAEVQRVKNTQLSDPIGEYFYDNEEVWYHWYTFFPQDLDIPLTYRDTTGSRVSAWHLVTQWHQSAGGTLCRNPDSNPPGVERTCSFVPMGLGFKNWDASEPESERPQSAIGETLYFDIGDKSKVSTTGNIYLWSETPLQKNVWYEFLLHVFWRACGEKDMELVDRYDENGNCKVQRSDGKGDGFQEMWIRHWNIDGTPIDTTPKYSSRVYHNNLDEEYKRIERDQTTGELKDVYYGCDPTWGSLETAICNKPDYNGAVYMKQGLYHCSPFYHQFCPGSGKVVENNPGPGEITCDSRAKNCPVKPDLQAPSHIDFTPNQTIYHDGMEYLRCLNIPTTDPHRNTVCEKQ